MQAEQTGYLSSQSTPIPVPDDFLEAQSVRIQENGQVREIYPLPPDRISRKEIQTGLTLGYVRIGSSLVLMGGSRPTAAPGDLTGGTPYYLTYFSKISALSDTPIIVSVPGGDQTVAQDTNWLLQKEPGLYLYGSLIEASPYLKDDERVQVWATQYQSILAGMKAADDRARYGNAPSMAMPKGLP